MNGNTGAGRCDNDGDDGYQAFLRQQEQQRQQFLQSQHSQQLSGSNFASNLPPLPPLGGNNFTTDPALEFQPLPGISVLDSYSQPASARQHFFQQPSDFRPVGEDKGRNPAQPSSKATLPSAKTKKKRSKSQRTHTSPDEIIVNRDDTFGSFREHRQNLRQIYSPNSISDSQSSISDSQSQHSNSTTMTKTSSSTKRAAATSSNPKKTKKQKQSNKENSKPSEDELLAQIARLQAQLQSKNAQKTKSEASSAVAIRPVSKGTVNMMHEAFKTCVYPDTKIINTDEAGKEVMLRVFHLIKHQLNLDDTNAEMDSFHLTYLKEFKQFLTNCRNSTQQELKKAALAWLSEKEEDNKTTKAGHEKLPSANLILKCALRQIDLENPQEAEVMEWHWTELLPILSKDWGDHEQCSQLPVQFVVDNEFSEVPVRMFHHRAEAYLVLLWENSSTKWEAVYKWKLQHPGEKLPSTNKDNAKDELHHTKYTKSCGGQKQWHGWNTEGLQRYILIQKSIRKARKATEEVVVEVTTKDGAKQTKKKKVSTYEQFEKTFLKHLNDKWDAQNSQEEQAGLANGSAKKKISDEDLLKMNLNPNESDSETESETEEEENNNAQKEQDNAQKEKQKDQTAIVPRRSRRNMKDQQDEDDGVNDDFVDEDKGLDDSDDDDDDDE